MAMQSASPPVSSPPSATNPQSSSAHPISHQVLVPSPSSLSQPSRHQEGAVVNNGVEEDPNVKPDVGVQLEPNISPKEEEPNFKKDPKSDNTMLGVENEETIKKYKKYETDYACYLLKKYFSNKDIHGDDIYESNFAIDDRSIRASKRPCIRSYANPLQSCIQPNESTSSPDALAEVVSRMKKLSRSIRNMKQTMLVIY